MGRDKELLGQSPAAEGTFRFSFSGQQVFAQSRLLRLASASRIAEVASPPHTLSDPPTAEAASPRSAPIKLSSAPASTASSTERNFCIGLPVRSSGPGEPCETTEATSEK